MSDIYDEIQAVLETTLNDITGIPEIAWEHGEEYEPTTGTPFVKPTFLPLRKEPSVVGRGPIEYYQGLFLVDCMLPRDSDRATKSALVSKVIEAFSPSSDLTIDIDTYVLIRNADRDQGITEGPFTRITVTINWQSYA